NLERAFPVESLSLRDWLPILEAGLANLTVGVVPPALDQVLIGAIDRSRNPELRLALVLGLNEGVFPAPPAPATLLTEPERTGLEQQGIYLGPTRYQRLGHERYLGYIAVTRASERLILTCAAQDAKGQPLNPSPFLDHIQRITGVAKETFSDARTWWQSEHLCELEAPALQMQRTEALAQFAPLGPVLKQWRQVRLAQVNDPLPPAVMERIFGRELKSSVSGLEDFAACAFKFFAARGLRLQERKEFQFDDRDKGSFQHDALEEFHRRVRASGRQWRDLTRTEAGQLIADIGRDLRPTFGDGKFQAGGAARFAGDYLIERLRHLVTTLIEWMPQYDFDPTVSEIAFDDDQAPIPAWRVVLRHSRALRLRGRIDRVDLCRLDDHTALAVVMDYKSRVRKLDPTKLHHGLELQLLSYLGVLNQLPTTGTLFGGKRLVPAGVFYIPLNGGGGKPAGTRAGVLASGKADQRTAYQHSGRFLADQITHFDNRGRPKGDQFKYARNKDGQLAKRGNEALAAAEFEGLREKIEHHLRDYGDRIFGGEVAVAPFRIGTATACDYCDFRPVCRFDPWTQPFRDLRPPPKPARDAAPKPGKPKSA
ncbi:MAG: PD-(D/E)XK nuclease family protein, partial [Verrucomicrobia bacterium]|nr:PD-(D/E)XK nuclease family protein [Verrucomicrobiota bacterium]